MHFSCERGKLYIDATGISQVPEEFTDRVAPIWIRTRTPFRDMSNVKKCITLPPAAPDHNEGPGQSYARLVTKEICRWHMNHLIVHFLSAADATEGGSRPSPGDVLVYKPALNRQLLIVTRCKSQLLLRSTFHVAVCRRRGSVDVDALDLTHLK